MIVITEFLYMHYRMKVLKTKFPIYIFQIIVYFMMVVIPEENNSKLVIDSLNIAAFVYSIVMLFMDLKYVGRVMF